MCLLGEYSAVEYLDAMKNEAPGLINFTMFLTMFGEKLNGTDADAFRNAFACFDGEATGSMQGNYLRELPTTVGDRFTDEEVGELCRESPMDKKEISTTLSSCTSLNMEQKTNMTEKNSKFQPHVVATLGISETFS